MSHSNPRRKSDQDQQALSGFNVLNACPICQSTAVKYVGKVNKRLRYECPDCDGMQFDVHPARPEAGGGRP